VGADVQRDLGWDASQGRAIGGPEVVLRFIELAKIDEGS